MSSIYVTKNKLLCLQISTHLCKHESHIFYSHVLWSNQVRTLNELNTNYYALFYNEQSTPMVM